MTREWCAADCVISHPCLYVGALQVAVHLGMMDDARKLYVAAERYDLLNKLYQVRRVQWTYAAAC